MRAIIKLVALLAAVAAGLVLFVEAVAYLAWALSPAGDLALETLDGIAAPERHPTEPGRLHALSEWPADRPRAFREAPAWRRKVERGELPPVAERLPEDPLVITPPEQHGPYGGTWERLSTGPADVATAMQLRICYEHLVRWDPMGRAVVPNLAAGWTVEDGGRTYTFRLRRGVRWSDGAPFSADDILFWYEHILLNSELTPVPPRDLRQGDRTVHVEKVDDHTVRFRFAEPYGLFIQQMASAMWAEAMVNHPAHYLKRFHPDFVRRGDLQRLLEACAARMRAQGAAALAPGGAERLAGECLQDLRRSEAAQAAPPAAEDLESPAAAEAAALAEKALAALWRAGDPGAAPDDAGAMAAACLGALRRERRAALEREARARQFTFWFQLYQDKHDWRSPETPRLWGWTVTAPPPARPIVFERNPYYWKVDDEGRQLPYIDRVTFQLFDLELINQKAITGEMGMQLRHLNLENYPLFMENRRAALEPRRGPLAALLGERKGGRPYRVLHWIDGGGARSAIALNLNHRDPVRRAILGDPRFRKALSLAINRGEINDLCYFGVATPRQMCPPPSSPFYVPEYERAYVAYDPGTADRLLDEMGLAARDADGYRLGPDGRTLALDIETASWTSNRELELVAESWRAVGIKAELKNEARQLFYARKAATLHDVGVWGSGDEQCPLLDPRWFIPYSHESIHAIRWANWFQSGGRQGEAPAGDMMRAIEIYRQIERTSDLDEQVRLFRAMADLARRNLWVIATVGRVPVPVIVQERFRNVPEVAVYGWIFRTPGNTAPECYAIREE